LPKEIVTSINTQLLQTLMTETTQQNSLYLAYGEFKGNVEFVQWKCGNEGGIRWSANIEWPNRLSYTANGLGTGSSYGFFIHEFGNIGGGAGVCDGAGDVFHHKRRLPSDLTTARGAINNGNLVCSGINCSGGGAATNLRLGGAKVKKNIVGRSVVLYSQMYQNGQLLSRPMACAPIVMSNKEIYP